MKKIVYQNLYKLLAVISGKVNNKHINRYKIAVGTSLLLLTSGCQTPKRNNQNSENKDTVYADSLQVDDNKISENIMCYDSVLIDSIDSTDSVQVPPPPIEKLVVTCYYIPPTEADTIAPDENGVYLIADEMPEYPGGSNALIDFIKNNIQYPEDTTGVVEGRVIIQFIIEKDGSLSSPNVVRSIAPLSDKIALDVVNRLPKFEPGTHKGLPERVLYTIPVTIKLQ